jgi:hypothetical protein
MGASSPTLALLSLPWACVLAGVTGMLAGGASVYGNSLHVDSHAYQLYTQARSKSFYVHILFMSAAILPLSEWISLPPDIAINLYNGTSVWLRLLPLILLLVIWILPDMHHWWRQRQHE